MAEQNDFEAELESMLKEGADVAPVPATPHVETPPAKNTIEAGGRKFGNVDELIKSHNALLKDYTRKSQAAKKTQEWEDFEKYLDENPDLKSDLYGRITDYQDRRKKTSGKTAQVNDEVAGKLSELESRLDDALLDREVSEIQARYNLDKETLDKVLKESLDNNGITLEKAYRLVMFDNKLIEANASASKKALADAEAKKRANVGSSTVPNVRPSEKAPSRLSEAEWTKKLEGELESYGFK